MNSGLKSPPDRPFNELQSVGSTNICAMEAIHDGTARNGETWFAHHQFAGKGQRGRSWTSAPGENVAMSIVWEPEGWRTDRQFLLSARVAITALQFLEALSGPGWTVKWPNDLYWNDRKAAGILIENVLQGQHWRYAVIGIGINVNVAAFPPELSTAVSLLQITGRPVPPVEIARALSLKILDNLRPLPDAATILADYNQRLYRRGEEVEFLEASGARFRTRVGGVNESGLLETDRGWLVHGQADWQARTST